MKKVFQRIYSDLFLPSRLEEYKNLLIEALENGYRIVSIEQFYDVIVNKNIENQNYLVLRHDIDTDASTAKLMFEVEKQL